MVKTKDFEKIVDEYDQDCNNVQLGIDSTDHIVFICNECKNTLEVKEVLTKNIVINPDDKTKDNCTWIYIVCHNCKNLGVRKFYWKSEDGRFCIGRTYNYKDNKCQFCGKPCCRSSHLCKECFEKCIRPKYNKNKKNNSNET